MNVTGKTGSLNTPMHTYTWQVVQLYFTQAAIKVFDTRKVS